MQKENRSSKNEKNSIFFPQFSISESHFLNFLKNFEIGFKWFEKYESKKTTHGLIPYFLKDAKNLFPDFEFIFLKYLPFQKSLMFTCTTLPNQHDFKGKAFAISNLNFQNNKEITLFFNHLLKKEVLMNFPLKVLNELRGVFLVLQNEKSLSNKTFNKNRESKKNSLNPIKKTGEESKIILKSYLFYSLKILSLIFEKKKFQTRLHNLDHEEKFPSILKKNFFLDELEKELSRARRIRQPLCLALVSIDDFFSFRHQLKEKEAHEREEKALQFLSLIFKKCFRIYDIFGLLNPSEFGILLPHATKENGAKALNRLLTIVKNADFSHFIGEKKEKLKLKISAGLSEYPSHCHSPDEMIQLADQALYEVKKQTEKKICISLPLHENFKPEFNLHPIQSTKTSTQS